MMTANEIDYKDACVSNASTDAITHKPDSLAYLWSLFLFSYRISLAEYN